MQKYIKYILILALIIIVFLLGRTCSPELVHIKGINVDSLKQANKNLEVDVELLTLKAIGQTDTVVKLRDRWHKGKHDTIIKNIVALCDTVIFHDSILIQTQKEIIVIDSNII